MNAQVEFLLSRDAVDLGPRDIQGGVISEKLLYLGRKRSLLSRSVEIDQIRGVVDRMHDPGDRFGAFVDSRDERQLPALV